MGQKNPQMASKRPPKRLIMTPEKPRNRAFSTKNVHFGPIFFRRGSPEWPGGGSPPPLSRAILRPLGPPLGQTLAIMQKKGQIRHTTRNQRMVQEYRNAAPRSPQHGPKRPKMASKRPPKRPIMTPEKPINCDFSPNNVHFGPIFFRRGSPEGPGGGSPPPSLSTHPPDPNLGPLGRH